MGENRNKWFFAPLLVVLVFFSSAHAQYFLFKHPRHGGFKFVPHDRYDFSNWQHFTGSGMLAVGFFKLFRKKNIRHAKVKAALLASTLGLLKEFEDGYREGWGVHDTIFNQLGIVSFLLLQNYTGFTLTVMPVMASAHDVGFGVRFFRSREIPFVRTSFGVFLNYNNNRRTWVGLDAHIRVHGRTSVRFGASMIKLQDANRFQFRPNIGLGFQLL